jgi:hypothetical protein
VSWPRKYVESNGRIVQYDLARDPRELSSLPGVREELERLIELARGARGPFPAPIPVAAPSVEERRELRDLGYGGEVDEER